MVVFKNQESIWKNQKGDRVRNINMAKCPSCKAELNWGKILKLDRTSLTTCFICGALLKLDAQRAMELMGVLVIILFLPATKMLPFELGWPWIIFTFVTFTPIWVTFSKLVIVEAGDLAATPQQEQKHASYIERRRRLDRTASWIMVTGFIVWGGDTYLSSVSFGEPFALLYLSAIFAGFLILIITRCPYCKKVTLRNGKNDALRCMHCGRDIGTDR